ncbi:MAG: DUF4268 domain-containing protein [Salinimicrobium sp.]
MREEFWTSFGKEYPRKWLLYDTKMRELQLKFSFERKFAMVSMDIFDEDDLIKTYYYEKLQSLRHILETEYLPDVIFDEHYELPEGKIISRIYTQKDKLSIYNKNDWPVAKDFLFRKMILLEEFFTDFSDFIKS